MRLYSVIFIGLMFWSLAWGQAYSGKRISLDWQKMPLRSALQTLARFTHANIVVSDGVKGNVTLNLHQVPWDEALALVVQSKGLRQRRVGQVIVIESAAQDSAPLSTALIPVHFAHAKQLAAMLSKQKKGLLGPQAHVGVDERTNTLIVRAHADRLMAVEKLIQRLDRPVAQVKIAARIAVVDKKALQELGVRSAQKANTFAVGSANGGKGAFGLSGLLSNGVANPAGTLGLMIGKLGGQYLLDLQLQALESEGDAKIVSTPQVTVADNQQAIIEQGKEVAFQSASVSGATQVQFRKAVLGLRVTPQITPNHKIMLTLQVNNDHAVPSSVAGGVPVINTTKVQTHVLADDGQTLVLGGLILHHTSSKVQKVPGLSAIPGLGWLFTHRQQRDDESELLVFVTPTIIKPRQ